jgi:probable F420-dependent oxidoreductase
MVELGRFGVWSGAFRGGDRDAAAAAAAELEKLGYGAIWVPGGGGGDVFGAMRTVLDATERVAVASGILNIWAHTPEETARGCDGIERAHPGRFLLGLGVSHQLMVDADEPGRYRRPVEKTRSYLDALDAANPPVPRDTRVLAALGPRMLELARDRTAGAHPYNVSPEHTARAREILGAGPLLAPEQGVILERDPSRARELARESLAIYLRLPNYVNNWMRLGFTEDDVAGDRMSDRLVDAIVAWGSPSDVARRVREHVDAGADHVCVQFLTGSRPGLPRDQWRELADELRA